MTAHARCDDVTCPNCSGLPESFDDPSVETVYTFGPKIGYHRFWQIAPTDALMPLVKRRDRHADGSVSTTYYLELTEDQYRQLGGE